MNSRRLRRCLGILALALAAAGCRSAAVAVQGDEEKPKRAPAGRAPEADEGWLRAADGRQYRLDPYDKNWRHLVQGGKLKTFFGAEAEIDHEDERFYYLRFYRVEEIERPDEAASAEALKRVADSFRADLPRQDRWQWVDFGRGLPNQGQWRQGFRLVDLNRDGKLDILHAPPRKSFGPPVAFQGDGRGGWKRMEMSFPAFNYDYGDLAVGDFNRDGEVDFALAVHLRGLAAFLGDGAGGFSVASEGLEYRATDGGVVGFSSRRLEAVDVDGDGRDDLVTLGEGPRMESQPGQGGSVAPPAMGVRVLLNRLDAAGKVRWEPQDVHASRALFADDFAIADWSGDGVPDLVSGSGTLGERDLFYLGDRSVRGGFALAPGVAAVRDAAYYWGVAVADVDGDGRRDVLLAYTSGELRIQRVGIDILYSAGAGSWQRQTLFSAPGITPRPVRLAVGDLNADGRSDIVALSNRGEVWTFLGKGGRQFVQEMGTEAAAQPGCSGYRAVLADLDGDGGAELVADFSGEGSALFAPADCPGEGAIKAWKLTRR